MERINVGTVSTSTDKMSKKLQAARVSGKIGHHVADFGKIRNTAFFNAGVAYFFTHTISTAI